MSQEHVDTMNALLAASPEVSAACQALDRPRSLGYRLSDGPDGGTVHWLMSFSDTVRFGLENSDADLVLVGDWASMIRSAQANREGHADDPGLVMHGEPDVMTDVAGAFAVASAVATIPVDFPEV